MSNYYPRSDIITALSVSYRLQKYLGITELDISGGSGERVVKKSNHKYKILPHIVLWLQLFMVWQNNISVKCSENRILSWYIHMCQLHMDFILNFLIIICSKFHSTFQFSIWNNFIRIDEKMRHLYIEIDNYRVKKLSIYLFLVNIILVTILFVCYNIRSPEPEYQWGHWIYLISSIYKSSLLVTFRDWTTSIRLRIKALNIFLCNSYPRDLPSSTLYAMKTQEIFSDLCRLTRTFNKIYSLPILVNMTSDAIQVLLCFYRYSTIFAIRLIMPSKTSELMLYIHFVNFVINIAATIWLSALLNKHVSISSCFMKEIE